MASFILYTSLQTQAQSVIRLALVDLDEVSHKGGPSTVRGRPGKGVVTCGVCVNQKCKGKCDVLQIKRGTCPDLTVAGVSFS